MPILIVDRSGSGPLMVEGNKSRALPFFDDGTMSLLASAAQAVTAMNSSLATDQKQIHKAAQPILKFTFERIQTIVGNLDDDEGLIYRDEDGGFICGSDGRPFPILPPLPLPPLRRPELENMESAIDASALSVITEAQERKISLIDIFENPAKMASELGVELTNAGADALGTLAPTKIKEIQDPVQQEVVGYIHSVIEDGRFIDGMLLKPSEVSDRLGVRLSDAAMDRVIDSGRAAVQLDRSGMHASAGSMVVAVGVGILLVVAVIWAGESSISVENPMGIKDRSGLKKF